MMSNSVRMVNKIWRRGFTIFLIIKHVVLLRYSNETFISLRRVPNCESLRRFISMCRVLARATIRKYRPVQARDHRYPSCHLQIQLSTDQERSGANIGPSCVETFPLAVSNRLARSRDSAGVVLKARLATTEHKVVRRMPFVS